MKASGFSPWRSGSSGMPEGHKRLELDQAQALLSEAGSPVTEGGSTLSRLLELRRLWGIALELNPDGDPGGEGPGARFAREVSAAIRRRLEGIELEGDQAQALRLEVELLDRRLTRGRGEGRTGEAGGEASAAPPEGPFLEGAYGAYVRGLRCAAEGRPAGAAEAFSEALKLTPEQPEAERGITRELLPVLFESGDDARLIVGAAGLAKALSMSGRELFDLGWALHWLARAQERQGEWRHCVESARESNLRLFQFGASQHARTIGVNYYMVARGMAEQGEWGEAAALAQLSLRALGFTTQYPGRADALSVLAQCLEAFGEEKPLADARGILHRLLEERPAVAKAETFYPLLSRRLELLGPGPISPRPG